MDSMGHAPGAATIPEDLDSSDDDYDELVLSRQPRAASVGGAPTASAAPLGSAAPPGSFAANGPAEGGLPVGRPPAAGTELTPTSTPAEAIDASQTPSNGMQSARSFDEITQAVGNAAGSALNSGLSKERAIEKVTNTAISLFGGHLSHDKAATVATAAVTAAFTARPRAPSGDAAPVSVRPSTSASASSTAETAPAALTSRPNEPPASSQAKRPSGDVVSAASTSASMDAAAAAPFAPPPNASSTSPVRISSESNICTSVSEPAAPAIAPASKDAADFTFAHPPSAPPVSISQAASIAVKSKKQPQKSQSSVQADSSPPAEKKRRKRVAFMNKAILAGPELYNHSQKLSASGLQIPIDQAVVVEQNQAQTPSRVIKIRGVITSVPRPKYKKDWFDVKWLLKGKAVLQTLDTKIPAKPQFRLWLTLAMEAAEAAGDRDSNVQDASISSSANQASAQESRHVAKKPSPQPRIVSQESSKGTSKIDDEANRSSSVVQGSAQESLDMEKASQVSSKGTSKIVEEAKRSSSVVQQDSAMDSAQKPPDVETKPSPQPRVASKESSNGTSKIDKEAKRSPSVVQDSARESQDVASTPSPQSRMDLQEFSDADESTTADHTTKDDYWMQCKRCKKWRLLPGSARNDKIPRQFYCEINVYDPQCSSCDAPEQAGAPKHLDQADGTTDKSAKAEESEKKKESVSTRSSKQAPNEFQSYLKGRPSLPANTKMNSNILAQWLFEVHVIPLLMKSGWDISKKKRVQSALDTTGADKSPQRTAAHYDFMFLPPGVQARAPFKKRIDYFDSRKGFLNYLASDKCKDDKLSRYALAFSDSVSRLVKDEAQRKQSGDAESFDAKAERLISKADKEARRVSDGSQQASKHAASSSKGSKSQEKITKRRKKAKAALPDKDKKSEASSDDDVLSNLRTQKKARASTMTKAKRAIFEETDSSSSDDEDVLAKYRSKGKKKDSISRDQVPLASSLKSAKSEEHPLATSQKQSLTKPTKMFKAARPFPRYIKGTQVELFPSEDVIRRDIVMPIVKDYRDTAPLSELTTSDGKPLRDDEILEIFVEDIPGQPDNVRFKAEGVDQLGSKVKSHIDRYIEMRESKHGEGKRPREEIARSAAHDMGPKTGSTANAKYPIGTAIRKHFSGHGMFQGKISSLPFKEHQYYRVIYDDGDDEDIAEDEIYKYVIDSSEAKKVETRDKNVTAKGSNSARGEGQKSLRAKSMEQKIPKKKRAIAEGDASGIVKSTQGSLPIPKKKRAIAEGDDSRAVHSTQGSLPIPKKKRAIVEADSNEIAKSTQGSLPIPKKRRGAQSTEQSLVPLRATTESALTQRINKRKRMETPGAEGKSASSTIGRLAATPRSTLSKQTSQQREYRIVFNPKEPLGFFVVTESKGNGRGTVCKITSVSPLTSKKDARLKSGTIVVAAGNEREAVLSHTELKKMYEDSRISGQFPIWFINTEVVASKEANASRFKKKSDWSSSGAWHGFSRVHGWPGGAKDFQVQSQQDQEGARQLKQSRRHHMPSIRPGGTPSSSPMPRPSYPARAPVAGSRAGGAARPLPSILHVHEPGEKRASTKSVGFSEPLFTKHVPPEPSVEMMREAGPDTRSGLNPSGNDALSYAVLNKDYRTVVQLLERDRAYANQLDSNRRLPMDYIQEMSQNLSREKQNLMMHANNSESLKKVEASIEDLQLKKKVLKIFVEAERIIDLAQNVKDWSVVELVVKGCKNLELTTRGKSRIGSADFLFCSFALDGSMDDRLTPKVPFSASPSWRKEACPAYTVECNTEIPENFRKDRYVDINLMKGDPSGETIKLGRWRESVERIHYHTKNLEEKELEGDLSKGEFLLGGSLVVGMKPLEMSKEMLDRKRQDIATRLSKLIDWVVAFREETSTSVGKSPLLQANISLPILHNLSLLHAAVYAADLPLVERLCKLGADLHANSIEGSALNVAEYLQSQAKIDEGEDSEDEGQESSLFNNIIRKLKNGAAASPAGSTATKKMGERGGKPTADNSDSMKESPSIAAGSELLPVGTTERSKMSVSDPSASMARARGSEATGPPDQSEKARDSGRRGVSNLPAWMTKGVDNQSSTSSTAETDAQTPSQPPQVPPRVPTQTPSQAASPSSSKRNEERRLLLPRIIDKNWLPQRLGMSSFKNRICRFYSNPKGSRCREGAQCKFAHVYPELGPVLDRDDFAPSHDLLNAYAPTEYSGDVYITSLSSQNEKGETFWTAAFCHRRADSVIYYAERGPQALRSAQGVYWYPDEESAILAVQRKVYAVVRPTALPLKRQQGDVYRMDGHRDSDRGDASRARRSTSPLPSPDQRPKKVLKFEPPAGTDVPKSSSLQDTKAPTLEALPSTRSMEECAQSKGRHQQPEAQYLKEPALQVQKSEDKTETLTGPPDAGILSASELPKLSSSNWFEGRQRAHPPMGNILDNDTWCRRAVMEMEGDNPNHYHIKEKINDSYELYYTAAFVDPSSQVVYYAERGKDGHRGDKGIYWYKSEDSARASVKRVVAAAQKMKRDAAPILVHQEAEPTAGLPSALVEESSDKAQKPAVIYTDSNKAQLSVHEASSVSDMSIDGQSSASSSSAEKVDNSDLPELSKDWVENRTERCRYYNSKKGAGCMRGANCQYAHVHLPVGYSRLKNIDPSWIAAVSDDFIHRKEALTSTFKLYYTAAYLNPSENLIYYAEGGKNPRQSPNGIFWYSDEEEAVNAVKRVVAASQGAQGPNLPSSSPPKGVEQSEGAVLNAIKMHPNLQIIYKKVFPGSLLKRTCWNVKKDHDGMVAVTFTPPPDTGFPPTHILPSWRGGGVQRGGKRWYKDEKTAKAAAFMKFLELCAKKGLVRDVRHAKNGGKLF